jgi:hypothetical protein
MVRCTLTGCPVQCSTPSPPRPGLFTLVKSASVSERQPRPSSSTKARTAAAMLLGVGATLFFLGDANDGGGGENKMRDPSLTQNKPSPPALGIFDALQRHDSGHQRQRFLRPIGLFRRDEHNVPAFFPAPAPQGKPARSPPSCPKLMMAAHTRTSCCSHTRM